MDVHGVSVKAAFGAWKWFPGFVLRRLYSKDRLEASTYVEIRSRHDPLQINLGPSAVVTLWLEIRNQSIVDIELDRACCILRIGSQVVGMLYLKREALPANSSRLIELNQTLHADQANLIADTLSTNNVSIEGYLEFNCKLHPFTKNIGVLSGIRPQVINAHHRITNPIIKNGALDVSPSYRG